ncbi:MAG: hypothetical protein QOE76_2320 [Frankiales bacterium]|jgi:heme A synthase|nr:hypothetical protein [Frankiales bacterium]
MKDDLLENIAREMHRASAGTVDCPNLIHRVAAGVKRRQRRRALRTGVALAAAALAPAILFGSGSLGGSAGSSVAALHAGASARAELALRRANPEVAAPLPRRGDQPGCARRPYCRVPV